MTPARVRQVGVVVLVAATAVIVGLAIEQTFTTLRAGGPTATALAVLAAVVAQALVLVVVADTLTEIVRARRQRATMRDEPPDGLP